MATAAKKAPERTCIACRKPQDKNGLVRFVRLADGSVAIDATGKARGRGAYVCPNEGCFESARRGRKLDAALKTRLSDEDYKRLETQFDDLVRATDAR